MGDQGPCGPARKFTSTCAPTPNAPKKTAASQNADDPNVIEVWNNVFMQFNRKADGSLEELPAKSVDTGMGFERLCRAVQGSASNYDTDVFSPLIQFLSSYSGIAYTGTYPGVNADWKKTDVAMRVVADHLRAVSFTIADGELPSNTGAGYVIRRILRRAVRYAYSFLNIKEPILYRMCPILADEFHDVFPELKAQQDFVVRVILEEEKSFLRTLESGLKRIETIDVQNNTVTGQQAFDLFDTYGFPIDLTRLLAKEKGWSVDEAGFEKALNEQKERSRKDAAKEVGDWTVLSGENTVEFVGYDVLDTRESHVVKYRTVVAKGQPQYQIVLDRTPFYPEGGGQVGDTGTMTFGNEAVRVSDTKKENDLVIHILDKLPADLSAPVVCHVDARKRHLTENNHSATHLLHAALRQVLGTHVQQKGSYLDDQALRFDFAHFQKLTDEEITRIERIVNEKIRQNIPLGEDRRIPIEEAKKAGAMMLFGEKYGETVRMITFDPAYSRELCGGCHVRATGQIGLFKITAETAVAAGVRRIEALTAEGAEAYISENLLEVAALKSMLKTKDIAKAVNDLQEDNKRLQKEIERLVQEQANALRGELRQRAEPVNGIQLIAAVVPITDANAVKTLAFELERELAPAVVAFGSLSPDGKPLLTVKISDELAKSNGLNAGTIVRELAQKFLKGGGGGQPFFATAGGSDAGGLEEAVQGVKGYL